MSPISSLLHRAGLLAASCATLVLAACTEGGQPLAPRNPESVPLAAIECSARVDTRTIACGSPRHSGIRPAASNILYGGQHQYVDLISGPASVTGDTVAFTVTIRNLIPQPVGTTDGATADSGGVKVFFTEPPAVTQGSGMVTVANADGVASFTASGQPFFRYTGLIRTDSLSATRTWKLRFSPGVLMFTFLLYVSAPVPYPWGWVDVSPAADSFMAGYDDTLHATVRSAVGTVVSGEPVTWASSSPDSAPVTPLAGDSLAVVHGSGAAAATITATSGERSGMAQAHVLARQASHVSVSGRQLIVRRRLRDGTLAAPEPYVMRGVAWSPAGAGTASGDPAIRRPEFAAHAAQDVPLMAAMNINTVRLFIDPGFDAGLGPAGIHVLDALYARGIMVVMTVDDALYDTTRVRGAVSYYRNHPAVLLWMLGNEWNIPIVNDTGSTRAIRVEQAAHRIQAAAALAKSVDPAHPVSTSYGDIEIAVDGFRLADTQRYVNTICTDVDVWGLNIYRARTFEALFQQWASITTRPMFLAEFGTDAFRTTSAGPPPGGAVDEAMQADWTANLWSDLYRNLSALDPAKVALGGAVFEWNDEWWKVLPSGSQETGGRGSGGHPDAFANEEYFGVVAIDRQPRQLYDALRTAFTPGSVPPAPTLTAQAVSAGATAGSYAHLGKDGVMFFQHGGGGDGGRGFNVAVLDPGTGAVIDASNFDTYGSRTSGTAMNALIAYLDGVQDGSLVLIAVGDEAGINAFESCEKLPFAFVEQGLSTLEALGATHIRSYCYWDSWSMITIKGNPASAVEQLKTGSVASVALPVTLE